MADNEQALSAALKWANVVLTVGLRNAASWISIFQQYNLTGGYRDHWRVLCHAASFYLTVSSKTAYSRAPMTPAGRMAGLLTSTLESVLVDNAMPATVSKSQVTAAQSVRNELGSTFRQIANDHLEHYWARNLDESPRLFAELLKREVSAPESDFAATLFLKLAFDTQIALTIQPMIEPTLSLAHAFVNEFALSEMSDEEQDQAVREILVSEAGKLGINPADVGGMTREQVALHLKRLMD